MYQWKRLVTIALAVVLLIVPAVALAQSGSTPAAQTGSQDKTSDKATSGDKAPSASPSTSGSSTAGQASPAMPASAEDCKNKGWEKFGLKSEAECVAKVKK